MTSQKPTLRGIETFAPDHWFADRSLSSVWISAFRVPGDDPQITSGIGVHLPDVFVVVGAGELSYFDGGVVEGIVQPDGSFELHASGAGRKTIPACNHILLLTPFDVDGRPGDEAEVRRRISTASAVLAISCGRFITSEHLFDNIAGAAGKGVKATSSAFRMPDHVPSPALPGPSVDALAGLGKALRSADPSLWRRVALALHWYDDALQADGRDALIKSWIALEVLGMPDSTNIRPLNEALAKAYGVPLADATETFYVGRLFGLRSRIVHNGDAVPIPLPLLRYMHGLFVDVLYSLLGLQSDRRAEAVLTASREHIVRVLMA